MLAFNDMIRRARKALKRRSVAAIVIQKTFRGIHIRGRNGYIQHRLEDLHREEKLRLMRKK